MNNPANTTRIGKNERLCSRKEIEKLFAGGTAVNAYPLKLIFIPREELREECCKAMFVVPKRNFRRAHDRNRLRRRMKEAYRLNKERLYQHLMAQEKAVSIAILYTSRKEEKYAQIFQAINALLDKLQEKT